MKHFASSQFWRYYQKLPASTRKLADKNFDLLKTKTNHPSLHIKKVGSYWSVRIGKRYRALAVEKPEGLIWFWIGKHSDYDKLITS